MSANWWDAYPRADQQQAPQPAAQPQAANWWDQYPIADQSAPDVGAQLAEPTGSYLDRYTQGVRDAGVQAGRAADESSIPRVLQPIAGAAEGALTLASGVVAPVAGAIQTALTGRPYTEARDSYIYEPRTAPGQAAIGTLGAVAKPVADVFEAAGEGVAKGATALGASPETAEQIGASAADAAGYLGAPRVARAGSSQSRVASTAGKQVERPGVPSAQDLAAAAEQAYQRAEAAGVVLSPQSVSRAVGSIRSAATRENLNPKLHPKAAAAVEHLEEVAAQGKPLTLKETDQLRQIVKDAQTSIDRADRRMASIVLGRFDDYLQKLGPADTLSGNASEAVGVLNEARQLYRRKNNAEIIDKIVRTAEREAEGRLTQAGLEHAYRVEFRKLARNEKLMRTFTPEQRAAIDQVVKGGKLTNALRNLAKFDPAKGGMAATLGGTLGGGAGAALGGIIGGVPGAFGGATVASGLLGGAAHLASRAATRRTTRSVEQAREALVGRGLPESRPEAQTNRIAQLSPTDDATRAGQAFDAERAAAAQAARDSYVVDEAPRSAVREITLETPEQNRIASLAPSVTAIEKEMREIKRRAMSLPNDSPELLELDARYSTLLEELELAKSRPSRNRIESLARGQ